MKPKSRRKGAPRPWYRPTIRRTQVLIAGVALTFGVLLWGFRHSDWARLYESSMYRHAVAEDRALKSVVHHSRLAQRAREVALLIARDSRLDAERWGESCSPRLVRKYPRLKAARRRTVMLNESERNDILQQLDYSERVMLRGAEFARMRAAFHARLRRKYERATCEPWMPLEPDPAPPSPPPLPLP